MQEENSVQQLIESCMQEEDKLYLCVSSPTIKVKALIVYSFSRCRLLIVPLCIQSESRKNQSKFVHGNYRMPTLYWTLLYHSIPAKQSL